MQTMVRETGWVTAGQLYLVPTPIGNLADMAERALLVLQQVDLIACEDTRHTSQLLSHYAIHKPLMSLHEHNEQARSVEVVQQLQQGKSVAYVSDAGTPAVSDPGYRLVQAVSQAGLVVSALPGASAVVTALSASGLDARSGFCFFGFVPTQNKEKLSWIEHLHRASQVSVFFEAPHRIMATLSWLAEHFPARQMVLAKELTKLHERYVRGSCREVLVSMQENQDWQRGEFVLILAAIETDPSIEQRVELALSDLLQHLLIEMPLSQAVKLACKLSGHKKSLVYSLALSLQEESGER